MADHITPQRTYAAGIRLTIFDAVSFTVDAVPQSRPNSSKDTAMKRVAIDETGPLPVEQRFVTADGRLFTEADLGRARQTADGTLVLLDAETVAAAKVGDLAKNEFTVSVHPAAQVEAACRPGANGYRLRPPRKASAKERALYATVRATIEASPDKAFVGVLRLRDSRAFYRLVVWRDQLLLSELIEPADLAEIDVIEVEPDAGLVSMAAQLAESTVTAFDPSVYHHDALAAFEAAVAAVGTVPAGVSATSESVVADPASAMFEQALAAVAPKNPARRRTAKPAAKAAPRRRSTKAA